MGLKNGPFPPRVGRKGPLPMVIFIFIFLLLFIFIALIWGSKAFQIPNATPGPGPQVAASLADVTVEKPCPDQELIQDDTTTKAEVRWMLAHW